ncbi:Complex 1 LYR protein [Trinorchestia longiramus]|nr:Complex 1 LYR protein [Trinorchestia longiramus]
MAARKEVLYLYKSLLKESKKLSSYNFREYALRRVRDAFRENASVTNADAKAQLIKSARENLEMLHRQAVISSLYNGPPLVLEDKSQR